MSKKVSGLLFIIFSLTALILAFQQKSYTKQSPELASKSLHTYNWQIFNSTSWMMDNPTLNQQNILSAQAIYYQEEQKIAQFTEPRFIQLSPNKTTRIQSQFATSTQETEIRFDGQVFMQTINPATHSSNKTLATEQITYNKTTQNLTSPVKVTLTDAQGHISGTGFKGNLETGHYQFASKVTTSFQPTLLKSNKE